jgi:hypothetical protein
MRFNDNAPASSDEAPSHAATLALQTATRHIEALFDRGTSSWNAGDLAGFLNCYEQSPYTSYLSGAQVVVGYAAIENMYATRIGALGAAGMGTLRMSLLRVALLGAQHAHVIGRFLVTHEEVVGGSESGIFSAVLHNSAIGWRIIADHTSS